MTSHNDSKDNGNIAKIALLPCYHISGGDPPHYPLIGKWEILCGPYFQNKDTSRRKFIRTSELNFDINEVLSQLNDADKEISLIVVILQASLVSFPKNLSKLKCPKLAIVCDTHHLLYPISTLLEYMKREKFEYILAASQPAHLHFFYEFGIKHLAMDPYLKVHFRDVNNKKPGITYIGHRWSSSHPRRSRLVQFLEKKLPKNNIPYHYYQRLPEMLWKKVLNQSKMVVISSLNGQFLISLQHQEKFVECLQKLLRMFRNKHITTNPVENVFSVLKKLIDFWGFCSPIISWFGNVLQS